MGELHHHRHLDKRFEGGPPLEALCLNCKHSQFLRLFSGPRYGDYDEGHDHPDLDISMATVGDVRASAKDCRLCYIVSAFHDAQHPGRDAQHPWKDDKCGGDDEIILLKPYRTDVILHMKDESPESDKETIATSVALLFIDPDLLAKRFLWETSNHKEGHEMVELARKAVWRRFYYSEQSEDGENNRHETTDGSFPAPQSDDEAGSPASPEHHSIQGSHTSALGTQHFDLQSKELPHDAYLHHTYLFCLTDTASPANRRALSFSKSAQGPQIDWPSLKKWVRACETDHPACCSDQKGSKPEEELHIRCLDLKSSTIVTIGLQTRYLALSYVWGTSHSELSRHILSCKVGDDSTVITENLPATIRDAVRVTRCLGERYLWVDCLCLDQSDAAIISEQIGFMDRIYESAVLTLITSTTQNVYSEIAGLRENSRLRSVAEVCIDGQVVKAVCATTVDSEFRGVWRHRAWTFQEWMLSKRCLFFSKNQVLFQCQELSGLESFHPPRVDSSSKSAAVHKFGADNHQCEATVLPKMSLDSPRWNIDTYSRLVFGYTKRVLTYASDILFAFTGILRKMERSTGMPFVEGLPARDLLQALLWVPNNGIHGVQKYRMPELPSWTWAAWRRQAQYVCYQVDGASVDENFFRRKGSRSPESKRSGIQLLELARQAPASVVLSISVAWGPTVIRELHPALQLRCATVNLLPKLASLDRRCLQIVSQTRSVLIHRNPPKEPCAESLSYFDESKDDLLHPVFRNILAGLNFREADHESRILLALPLSVGVTSETSISSHDAVLLQEWNIGVETGKWYQKVIALIVDRLGDDKVERVSLVSINSQDWRTLPLVSENEILTLL